MKTDERNKFAIKSFLGEYLDLRKIRITNWPQWILSVRGRVQRCQFMDPDFCHLYGITRIECKLYRRNHRCHVDFSVDGTYYGVGLSVGLNDFELMKRSLKSFLITTAFSVTTATIFFLLAPYCRFTVRVAGTYIAHYL